MRTAVLRHAAPGVFLPSHLSSIGFAVESPDEFRDLAERVSQDSEVLEVYHGRYLRWTSDVGAELWLQLNRDDQLVGMMPHFNGESRRHVAVVKKIARPDDTDWDGALYAWANPRTDDPETGDYPFVFDCPDFAVYRRLEVPYRGDLNLVGFAHELVAYSNAEAFIESQKEEPKFSPEFFVPTGLFAEDNAVRFEAQAIFAGEVLETEHRVNPLTGVRFRWARVRTLGGELDVVADPELVEGSVRRGAVVRGSFWLTGRLVGYDPNSRRGFLGVLLG